MIPNNEMVIKIVIIVKVRFTNKEKLFRLKDKSFLQYQASGKFKVWRAAKHDILFPTPHF